MAGPNYGALGLTFKACRALQAICMVVIIGLTANFISQIVSSNQTPPQELIGTISVVCIAILYCVITVILFFDNILPFLINTIVDGLVLIALIVITVVVGRPLSYMNCQAIGDPSDSLDAYSFTVSLGSSINKNGGTIDFTTWSGFTKANCLESKSIWGLCISLW